MTIKQDLRSINKDIKALSKKVDGLLKTVEKSEAAKLKPASGMSFAGIGAAVWGLLAGLCFYGLLTLRARLS